MTNEIKNSNEKIYDLIERTALFGEDIIDFMKVIKKTEITRPLISQLVRSRTSIGANYMEADTGESKKDFCHKLGIARKESKETMHWLRMVAKAESGHTQQCRKLWKEAQEFVFIFSSIITKTRNGQK